jgi:predicted nucleic acid-binding protein
MRIQNWFKTSDMRAVSNTSPISNLASIGRLELLKSQFSQLWIPDAVVGELAAHPDTIAQATIQKAIRDRWIQIATPGDSGLRRLLLSQLHRGEAEAIALATELKADIVLIDDRKADSWHRRLASLLRAFSASSYGPSGPVKFMPSSQRYIFSAPKLTSPYRQH